jgi:hypothetical protein
MISWAARTFEVAPSFRCSSDTLVEARMRGTHPFTAGLGLANNIEFREFGVHVLLYRTDM